MNQKGAGLIESIILLPVIVFMLSQGSFVIYHAFTRYWLEHCLIQGLFCYHETQSKALCKKSTSQKVNYVLPYGSIKNITFKKSALNSSYYKKNLLYGKIRYHLNKNKIITVTQIINPERP